MNGGDIGSLKRFESFKKQAGLVSAPCSIAAVLLQPLLENRIACRCPVIVSLFKTQEPLKRSVESLADAVTQFISCCFCERHHKKCIELELSFHHKPHHQMGQGKGFAGACAGLQQSQPRGERVAVRLEADGAGFSSTCHWLLASRSGAYRLSKALSNPGLLRR